MTNAARNILIANFLYSSNLSPTEINFFDNSDKYAKPRPLLCEDSGACSHDLEALSNSQTPSESLEMKGCFALCEA